ncbi:MAG: WG repeat-containing protein [Bacteroidota bacterium]
MGAHYLKLAGFIITSFLSFTSLWCQSTDAISAQEIKETFDYFSVGPFHQGYATIQVNEKYYSQNLVNTAGELILKEAFQTVEYIPNASVFVVLRYEPTPSAYSIFDPANPTKELEFKFDRYKAYDFGLVLEGETACGVIGPNGEVLAPTIYDSLKVSGELIVASLGKEQTVYNNQGKKILVIEADVLMPLIYRPLSDESRYFIIGRHGKFGLYDTEGQNKPNFIYDALRIMARGEKEILAVYKGKTGVIDMEGNVKVPFEYESLSRTLCESAGRGYYAKLDKWGYYHPQKGITVPCVYDNFLDICNAFGHFVMQDGKWGMVSFKGEDRLPFQFDTIGVLSRGNLIKVEKDGFTGIVDTVGRVLVPLEYDKVTVSKSITVTNHQGKKGAYFLTGKLFMPAVYDFINLGDNGIWRVIEGDSTMYFDSVRKQITDNVYGRCSKVHRNGLAVVCQDKKWGVIDENGTEVIPLIYENMYGYEPRVINGKRQRFFGVVLEGERFKIDAEGACIEDCPDPALLQRFQIPIKDDQ